MFDFDPDTDFDEDMSCDPDGDYQEDMTDETYDETDSEKIESNIVDDSIVEEAIIGGAIFGMGREAGLDERGIAEETYREFDEFENERENCISLEERKTGPKGKKPKLRPFEQWVQDVITGKKDLCDD